jgi:hypothetical protein
MGTRFGAASVGGLLKGAHLLELMIEDRLRREQFLVFFGKRDVLLPEDLFESSGRSKYEFPWPFSSSPMFLCLPPDLTILRIHLPDRVGANLPVLPMWNRAAVAHPEIEEFHDAQFPGFFFK